MIRIADEIFLTMGIENGLTLFPPADRPNLYSKLEGDLSNKVGTDIRILNVQKPYYGPRGWILFDKRLIVSANMIEAKGKVDVVKTS